MLLDQTSGDSFQVDYRFEPQYLVNTPAGRFVAYSLGSVNTEHVTGGGTILIPQWIPESNRVPPIFGAIVYDDSGTTKLLPIASGYPGPKVVPSPKLNNYYYGTFRSYWRFDPSQRVRFDEYQLLGVTPNGTFKALYRSDHNCDGCNHIYTARDYFFQPAFGLSGDGATPDAFSDPIPNTKLRVLNAYVYQ